MNRKRDEIVAGLQTSRRETNRLERIARALPLLPTRRALMEELAAIGEVPALSENFAEQRLSACASLETGRSQVKANETLIAELDARISTLFVPAPLLAREQVITDLHQRLQVHLKAARDLPALYAELRTQQKAMARLREDLRLGEQGTARVSRGVQSKVQTLANQHQALVGKAAAGRPFTRRNWSQRPGRRAGRNVGRCRT